MSAVSDPTVRTAARARELELVALDAVARRTDRLFAWLLVFQWVVAVGLAVWVTPVAWAGSSSATPPHALTAVLIGLLAVAPAVALALLRPGRPLTRHVVAAGQIFTSILLIHLTGGRIATHFHVFGSLTFLAFYRDWRVLLTASAITVADYVFRGAVWPESVYGTASGVEWRWIEHAGWVAFIDVFLVYACLWGVRDVRDSSFREAELETARAQVEVQVWERTRKLQESEERMRALLEHGTDFVSAFDPHGRILYESPSVERLGRTPGEMVGREVWDYVHPDDVAAARDRFATALQHPGQIVPVEARFRDGTGEWRTLEGSGRFTPGIFGAGAVVVTTRDVTERKRAEEELEKARGQLMDAIETLDAGFVMYGPDERLVVCNGRYKEIYAAAAHAMKPGAAYEDVLRAFYRAGAVAGRGWSEDEFVAHRLEAHRNPGEPAEWPVGERWIRISDRRTRDGGIVSLRTDITDLKRAREAAEAANRAKSQFLANMSHEIRTPMNGVLGLTDLVLESELTGEQRESLTLVKSSADALLTVINDILDFSKIEAGKLDLDPVRFALRDATADALRSFALRAHKKGLELTCDVRPEVPDSLVGDDGRLRQVLTNLIGNAVKFTEKGEVEVRVELAERNADRARVRFTVRDTGIGISAEKLATVFDPFTQADGSATRRYGGTGLGLTICARLVELMGGRIWVESQPGKGSQFHFEAMFDVARGSAARSGARALVSLRGVPVLVVDDNPTNRRVLEETLRLWDARPTCVESGPAALEELRRAAGAGEPYTLVLLDAMMPDMDGFTVAEQMAREPDQAGAAVMMLSSADRQGDGAKCRTLGLAAYLVKPVKSDELFQAIASALALSVSTLKPKPSSIHAPPAARPLRVLLAEDNAVNQRVAVRLLEKLGHSVTVANHGGEAIAELDRGEFDLVLMDVQMPEVDGFEATRRIREREAAGGRRTPIVAMTAHAMKGDRERCLAAGMDDYLAKPVQRDDLLRVLAWAADNLPGPAEEGPGEWDDTPAFDGAAALDRLGGDEELFVEVVELFRADAERMLGDIRTALAAGDAAAVQRTAHGLKGAAGYVGGGPAAEASCRLEAVAAAGDLAALPAAVRTLDREIARLTAALAETGRPVAS